jgi:hypothetical protein
VTQVGRGSCALVNRAEVCGETLPQSTDGDFFNRGGGSVGKGTEGGGVAWAHAQGGGGGAWMACDVAGRRWGSSAGRSRARWIRAAVYAALLLNWGLGRGADDRWDRKAQCGVVMV